ncbi:hypothetical protein FVE85_3384 [Porphyridium purpureum]|uniref:Protein translocase subunit SecE n=1 Tax=Porphyridium purpureum TaxID=35688 RepID=A0A5J4YWP6_PORPP|nr:hypothetical protein FVE85_3384 [Porphyridium purpureum]|eukprot:POR8089..scf227_4
MAATAAFQGAPVWNVRPRSTDGGAARCNGVTCSFRPAAKACDAASARVRGGVAQQKVFGLNSALASRFVRDKTGGRVRRMAEKPSSSSSQDQKAASRDSKKAAGATGTDDADDGFDALPSLERLDVDFSVFDEEDEADERSRGGRPSAASIRAAAEAATSVSDESTVDFIKNSLLQAAQLEYPPLKQVVKTCILVFLTIIMSSVFVTVLDTGLGAITSKLFGYNYS